MTLICNLPNHVRVSRTRHDKQPRTADHCPFRISINTTYPFWSVHRPDSSRLLLLFFCCFLFFTSTLFTFLISSIDYKTLIACSPFQECALTSAIPASLCAVARFRGTWGVKFNNKQARTRYTLLIHREVFAHVIIVAWLPLAAITYRLTEYF